MMLKNGRSGEFEIRTDLALEERESFPGDGGEVSGVSLREWREETSRVKLTEVKILDERGAKAMGKPCGTYLTLEADQLAEQDEDYHAEVSEELGRHIRNLIGQLMKAEMKEDRAMPEEPGNLKILAVGLGNASVTPDALGPKVISHLQVTRHLEQQYGNGFCRKRELPVLSGIVPGVMAQTGMETAEILKGVIRETRPDLVIAIDALAARSIRRLGTTIQLTDTGIHPGSGVGNHRHSLTRESLGIPVLAIGVPTVVGAAAIVHDTVNTMIQTLNSSMSTKGMGEFIRDMAPDEQYDLIRELLEPEFGGLYVTPPNIDEMVGRLSFTISEGIHEAVF
ncbi:MAG: GPR endopeptidase [Lachnospiraceae bacterium]|nr:GPR endopeptidase [Lachnospiraceae bacterium]